MKKSTIIVCLTIFFACFCLANTGTAADWYNCMVYKIVPYPNGAISVQFTPGVDEIRFLDNVARAAIPVDTVGANKMMAVLLSAMVQGWEVSVFLDSAPGWSPVQVINSVGLISPLVSP